MKMNCIAVSERLVLGSGFNRSFMEDLFLSKCIA